MTNEIKVKIHRSIRSIKLREIVKWSNKHKWDKKNRHMKKIYWPRNEKYIKWFEENINKKVRVLIVHGLRDNKTTEKEEKETQCIVWGQ